MKRKISQTDISALTTKDDTGLPYLPPGVIKEFEIDLTLLRALPHYFAYGNMLQALKFAGLSDATARQRSVVAQKRVNGLVSALTDPKRVCEILRPVINFWRLQFLRPGSGIKATEVERIAEGIRSDLRDPSAPESVRNLVIMAPDSLWQRVEAAMQARLGESLQPVLEAEVLSSHKVVTPKGMPEKTCLLPAS